MTYLIVGCGNLGSELACRLKNAGKRVVASYCSSCPRIEGIELVKCDVTKPDDVDRLMDCCPGELVVFWLAASHNVDKVQANPDVAREVNVCALERFISRYSKRIEKLFFSSTDCVYGEMKEGMPADEGTELMPVNEYGHQKTEAESLVKAFGGTCLRFSLLIGESCSGKQTFYSKMKKNVENGGTLELATDSRRPALSYWKAAELTFALSELDDVPSTVNVCSDEFLSKFEIGERLCERAGKSTDCFLPVSSAAIPFTAPRVKNHKSDNRLLKKLLDLDIIDSGL